MHKLYLIEWHALSHKSTRVQEYKYDVPDVVYIKLNCISVAMLTQCKST